MSKKKGKTVDEKRDLILGVYREVKEPLNLKEIENIASKKGVVQQTIKEVNQSLVDDNLVLTDKIGSANFFWSFPSKAYHDRVVEKQLLTEQISQSRAAIAQLQKQRDTTEQGRTDPERPAKIQRLRDLRERDRELDLAIAANAQNDPEMIKKIERDTAIVKEGADRWTENVWAMKTWLTKKKGISSNEVSMCIVLAPRPHLLSYRYWCLTALPTRFLVGDSSSIG
jgi:Mnd1 HTH domain/Leucine zipper with capping helix domain